MEERLFTIQEASRHGRLGPSALRKRCERGEAGRKYGKTWFLTSAEVRMLQKEGYRKSGRPNKLD